MECVEIQIDEDTIVQWVEKYYDPEDVFSTDRLDAWAESNGWVRP